MRCVTAFDHEGDVIRIDCRVSGKFVECRVSDHGSASMAEVGSGRGLRIIETLEQSLGADFQFNFGEDGSEFILIFSINQNPALS